MRQGGSTVIGAATLGFEALGSAELAGTTIGSRALWGLAVHVPVTRSVGTSVEVNGSSYLTDLAKPGSNPIEAIASGRLALSEQLSLSLGAGTALTRAHRSPSLRTLAGLSLVPEAAAPPRKAALSSPKVAQAAAPPTASEGLLRISTADAAGDPVMAQFWIEGADTRTLTNADGIGLLSLPPGDHTLRVSASGYASIRRQMRIEPGVERDLLISLSGSRASIANDRIIIDDKVYFETGSADLLAKSHSLLDEIALLILDNAQLSLIEVQGHTDSVGRAQDNLTLSAARARRGDGLSRQRGSLRPTPDRQRHGGRRSDRGGGYRGRPSPEPTRGVPRPRDIGSMSGSPLRPSAVVGPDSNLFKN